MDHYGVFDIRLADEADAEAVAEVQVASWRQAYNGTLPDQKLDALDADEQAREWVGALEPTDTREAWLATREDDAVGFCVFGDCRDEDTADDLGELHALYVDPEHWGGGIGSALDGIAVVRMRTLGFERANLWVLADNERARGFYESSGWQATGKEDTKNWDDHPLECVEYRRSLYPDENRS
ncbi:MAG: N-acetyltransferase family protein [Bradymonadaceae bacterium]